MYKTAKKMIKVTKQQMQLLDQLLSEAFLASTKCFFPSFVFTNAFSMLKSIQSTIVPCSITKTETSLKIAANALVCSTISSISLFL